MISKKNRKNPQSRSSYLDYQAISPKYVFHPSTTKTKSGSTFKHKLQYLRQQQLLLQQSSKQNISRTKLSSQKQLSSKRRNSLKTKDESSKKTARLRSFYGNFGSVTKHAETNESQGNLTGMSQVFEKVVGRCGWLLDEYRERVNMLELQQKKLVCENRELRTRLGKYQNVTL